MNCIDVQVMLSVYIDGECTQQEQEEIKAHLEQCEKCREEFNALKALLSKLNDIKEFEVPEGFHQELMQKLQPMMPSNKSKKKWYANLRQFSAIAAGLVLIVTLSFLGIQQFGNMNNKSSDSHTSMEAPKSYQSENTADYDYVAEYPSSASDDMSSMEYNSMGFSEGEDADGSYSMVSEENYEMSIADKLAVSSTPAEDNNLVYSGLGIDNQKTNDSTDNKVNGSKYDQSEPKMDKKVSELEDNTNKEDVNSYEERNYLPIWIGGSLFAIVGIIVLGLKLRKR